jgi:CO/xanthine dehydrogenase FAD-binding subunit
MSPLALEEPASHAEALALSSGRPAVRAIAGGTA